MEKVSRQGLVQWVNSTLGAAIVKLDEMGNGSEYCQLANLLYGDVPLNRVNYEPKTEYDRLANFKILQACFTRSHVDHTFDAVRLAKCRLQDNLDFTQWFYRQFHTESERDTFGRASLSGPRRVTSGSSGRGSATSRRPGQPASRQSLAGPRVLSRTPSNADRFDRVQELQTQAAELKQSLEVADMERTMYYGKLLEIEQLVQQEIDRRYAADDQAGLATDEHMLLVRNIQAVLFAGADGFEAPVGSENAPF